MDTAHVIKFNHTVSCLKKHDDDDDDYARELIRFMFINRENLEPYIYVVESNPNVFQQSSSSSFIEAKSFV